MNIIKTGIIYFNSKYTQTCFKFSLLSKISINYLDKKINMYKIYMHDNSIFGLLVIYDVLNINQYHKLMMYLPIIYHRLSHLAVLW